MIAPISSAVGPLDPSEWTISPVSADGGVGASALTPTDAPASGAGSFSSALTGAIGSLEQSQATASTAAQQLATGQLSDPTQAITAVENASLSMQLAAQVRTKLDEAVTTIFQTAA
jgi:flagellar hook-basal body complex protein FliE